MGDLTRWSLKVSRETDIALRTLLATRGGKKGDMSRFVEDAVNREVLRETIRDVQARNADADPDELQSLIDEEVADARASFWTRARQ
ncbi:MAG TPA: ribbon-helix-helix domain-containing protein [Novosphingobium sp.]